jgi:hypothetical protein
MSQRLPPKAERRQLLRDRGWTRLSGHNAEDWIHPRYGSSRWFTLSAAYRAEVAIRPHEEASR